MNAFMFSSGSWVATAIGLFLMVFSGCAEPPPLVDWRDQLLQIKEDAIAQRPLATVRRINGTYQDDLFLLKPDGSDPLRVTHTGASEAYPQWSPDGRQIAFWVLGRMDQALSVALHSINADGSAERQLIAAFAIEDTRWLTWVDRPLLTGYVPFVWMINGEEIVFEKPDTQLYVVDRVAGVERPLLAPPNNPFQAMSAPAYSMRTGELAFTGVLTGSQRSDIFIYSTRS